MSRLDVLWLPAELADAPPGDRAVVVIDVVRATTSIATALAAGATRVIPVASVVDARREAARLEGALLCGERNGRPPEGFDLGNSPSEFAADRVAGRPLVFTTTNGTAAMRAALDGGAGRLRLACFRNLEAVGRRLVADLGRGGVQIVCSGRRSGISMDDAWCAGHLVGRIADAEPRVRLGEGARAARFLAEALGDPTPGKLRETEAGGALVAIGLGADLTACASLGDLGVVPVWRSEGFVAGGEEGS